MKNPKKFFQKPMWFGFISSDKKTGFIQPCIEYKIQKGLQQKYIHFRFVIFQTTSFPRHMINPDKP